MYIEDIRAGTVEEEKWWGCAIVYYKRYELSPHMPVCSYSVLFLQIEIEVPFCSLSLSPSHYFAAQ